jgi:glutaconate CoA-transferase subunit B
MADSDCTALERIAILLSREIRDNEVGAWGVGGIVPMAAVRLAQHLHAPGVVIGGERIFNPKPSRLAAGLDDPVLMERAEAIEGFWELFGHWHKGVDFFFYSGMQIDAYGNINLHVIGSAAAPKLRGPGVANISLAQSCGRILLYAADHEPRRFVDKVDFVSVPGHVRGPASKVEAGIRSRGPTLCVTPLAVMDFEPTSLRMRLRSVHGGATESEVRQRTGFELAGGAPVGATPAPTPRELEVLRERVDPEGLLRKGD